MSKDKQRIYKPQPISGFSEWLPEIRMVELQWLDHIRKTFESYGYGSIETPAVEELDVLLAKGETDKEIYTLTRLQADEDDSKDARLGLHFDQTVPLARYTAQHFNDLVFPFKRYQMQKVWRGERPQLGRSREFVQCDIDVINVDHLPLSFDVEMPAVIYEALDGLDIGRFQISISNRKILLGLLEHLGIEDTISVTRNVDKLEKLGKDSVSEILSSEVGLDDKNIQTILDLATTDQLSNVDAKNSQMEEGLEELTFVMDQLSYLPDHAVKSDLSIVRGLDYYTGTVYETKLLDMPEFQSSICSGGRYDDLASSYINKKLPGVGISIGFTRLFEVMHHAGKIAGHQKSPADVLVVLPSEEARTLSSETARSLRQRGLKVEQYHAPQKLKKQLSYAEKKGIPYIWFPPFDDGQPHEVKNMKTGEQTTANPIDWSPEEELKHHDTAA